MSGHTPGPWVAREADRTGFAVISTAEEGESEKLKPCPFCGSESAPKIIVYYKSAYVSCDIDDGGCGAEFDSLPGEHAAIAAWNKRADQAKELAGRAGRPRKETA